MMPANPVRVENIKAPELAVKGASERKYCRGIYGNKIHVKDTIMVPIYEKFNIQIPESLYRSKIASPDTTFEKSGIQRSNFYYIGDISKF